MKHTASLIAGWRRPSRVRETVASLPCRVLLVIWRFKHSNATKRRKLLSRDRLTWRRHGVTWDVVSDQHLLSQCGSTRLYLRRPAREIHLACGGNAHQPGRQRQTRKQPRSRRCVSPAALIFSNASLISRSEITKGCLNTTTTTTANIASVNLYIPKSLLQQPSNSKYCKCKSVHTQVSPQTAVQQQILQV